MFPWKSISARTTTLVLLIIVPSILLIIIEISSQYSPSSGIAFILVITGIFLFLSTEILAYIKQNDFMNIIYYSRTPFEYPEKTRLIEAAIEYQFSRKLFYVAAAISILTLFLLGTIPFYLRGQLSFQQTINLLLIIVFFLTIFSSATVILTTRFALQRSRKDFGFHLARAYYIVSFQKEDSVEKFKYLTLVLDTYNRFLENNLKLKIKDIMRIYSIMMSVTGEQKIKIRESIGKALEKDKLELARQLAELSSLPDKEEFLIKERSVLNQQFKDVLTILIPAAISIVGFTVSLLTQFRILVLPP
jgi:hypothetical protein